MNTQHLHERLEQLHNELQQIDSVDERDREALQQLMTDIQELQKKGESTEEQNYTQLGERLRDGVAQLEASQPTVTMLMGQIVDMLAKMGI